MRSNNNSFFNSSSQDDNEDFSTSQQAPLLPLRPPEDDVDEDDINTRSSSRARSPPPRRRRSPPSSATFLSSCTHHLRRIGFSLSSRGASGQHKSGRRSVRRRVIQYSVVLIFAPLALLAFSILWWGGIPHSYADIRRMERMLPQHRWKDVRVDSSTGELVDPRSGQRVNWEEDAGEGYLRFPNHLWGHGLNNVLEEVFV